MCRQKLRNEVPAARNLALSCRHPRRHPRRRKRPVLARLFESVFSFHFGFSAAVENLRWVRNIPEQGQTRVVVDHIEAWQRTSVLQAEYCRQHRFDEKTFTRWLKRLAGEEAARKLWNIRRNCAARSAVRRRRKD
ncbi:IS66 family insertion sequence element accessory protein TnpA [Bradyrhizobium sp. URHC0002]